jgi:hypothetical protein
VANTRVKQKVSIQIPSSIAKLLKRCLVGVGLLFLLAGCGGDSGQGINTGDNFVTWEIVFGDYHAGEGNSIQALDEGNFVVTGYTYSETTASTDIVMLRITMNQIVVTPASLAAFTN